MDARVKRVETGNADRNAWVIGDDDEVIVVDPGEYADPVFDAIGDREIIAVICTHGHAAHTGAAPAVAGRDESPIALHPKDRLAWREAHNGELPEIEMEDGGSFEVADVALEVVHTPGHTPGSVCFALKSDEGGLVFTGDTLFRRGIGRTAAWFFAREKPDRISCTG